MDSSHRMLATIGWQRHGQTTYLLEGSIFMGGATVQWLRDGLGHDFALRTKSRSAGRFGGR
jgi:glycerol kinase